MFHVQDAREGQVFARKNTRRHRGSNTIFDTATPTRSYSMPWIDHCVCVGYGAHGFWKSGPKEMIQVIPFAGSTVGFPAFAIHSWIQRRGGEPSTEKSRIPQSVSDLSEERFRRCC